MSLSVLVKVRQSNACALLIPGARALVAEQLHQDKVSTACFQEGCARNNRVYSAHGFIMIQSKRTEPGQKGCEVWISERVAIGKVGLKKIFPTIVDVTSLLLEQRLVIVYGQP